MMRIDIDERCFETQIDLPGKPGCSFCEEEYRYCWLFNQKLDYGHMAGIAIADSKLVEGEHEVPIKSVNNFIRCKECVEVFGGKPDEVTLHGL